MFGSVCHPVCPYVEWPQITLSIINWRLKLPQGPLAFDCLKEQKRSPRVYHVYRSDSFPLVPHFADLQKKRGKQKHLKQTEGRETWASVVWPARCVAVARTGTRTRYARSLPQETGAKSFEWHPPAKKKNSFIGNPQENRKNRIKPYLNHLENDGSIFSKGLLQDNYWIVGSIPWNTIYNDISIYIYI